MSKKKRPKQSQVCKAYGLWLKKRIN